MADATPINEEALPEAPEVALELALEAPIKRKARATATAPAEGVRLESHDAWRKDN